MAVSTGTQTHWGKSPFKGSILHTAAHTLQAWPILTASQSESQYLTLMFQVKISLTYKRRTHTTHIRDTYGEQGTGDQGYCATGPYIIHTEVTSENREA